MLPAFWHIESRRWIDWKEITPIPDGAHELRQIWNTNCFNCHATNLSQGFDSATKRYNTTWTEMGIGCEACHGPGRPHVALMEAWEKNPAASPLRQQREEPRAQRDPEDLFARAAAAPRQTYDTCAYCHGNKTERVPRLPRRRSLRGLRDSVSDQRADSRQRLSGRVLARRPAEPLQSSAGADAERLLQGGRGRLHQLSRRARLTQSVLAQGRHHAGPQRRSALHAVSSSGASGAGRHAVSRCSECACQAQALGPTAVEQRCGTHVPSTPTAEGAGASAAT